MGNTAKGQSKHRFEVRGRCICRGTSHTQLPEAMSDMYLYLALARVRTPRPYDASLCSVPHTPHPDRIAPHIWAAHVTGPGT